MNIRELINLLRNAQTIEEIDAHRKEIAKLIPTVRIMFDYDQKNPYHDHDLWEHSLMVVAGLSEHIDDDMIYLAALLHDIGKPASCYRSKRPEDPWNHFYGHAKKSAGITKTVILPEIKKSGMSLSNDDAERLIYYIEHHDDNIHPTETSIAKHIRDIPRQQFRNLLQLQLSDAYAHVLLPAIQNRIADTEQLLKMI